MTCRRGAAAVEFALTLPVLLILIAGIVELGMFVSFHHVIGRAVREGARVGSTTIEGDSPTGDIIEAEAIAQTEFVLATLGYPCTGNCDVDAEWHVRADNYRYLTVSVEFPYDSVTGLLAFLDDILAEASFTMLTQQQDESEV